MGMNGVNEFMWHQSRTRNPSMHVRTQAISLAYEVLRDDNLRKQYDTHGLSGLGPRFESLQGHVAEGVLHQHLMTVASASHEHVLCTK
jgi:DnaJ-class molecular chaperone